MICPCSRMSTGGESCIWLIPLNDMQGEDHSQQFLCERQFASGYLTSVSLIMSLPACSHCLSKSGVNVGSSTQKFCAWTLFTVNATLVVVPKLQQPSRRRCRLMVMRWPRCGTSDLSFQWIWHWNGALQFHCVPFNWHHNQHIPEN